MRIPPPPSYKPLVPAGTTAQILPPQSRYHSQSRPQSQARPPSRPSPLSHTPAQGGLTFVASPNSHTNRNFIPSRSAPRPLTHNPGSRSAPATVRNPRNPASRISTGSSRTPTGNGQFPGAAPVTRETNRTPAGAGSGSATPTPRKPTKRPTHTTSAATSSSQLARNSPPVVNPHLISASGSSRPTRAPRIPPPPSPIQNLVVPVGGHFGAGRLFGEVGEFEGKENEEEGLVWLANGGRGPAPVIRGQGPVERKRGEVGLSDDNGGSIGQGKSNGEVRLADGTTGAVPIIRGRPEVVEMGVSKRPKKVDVVPTILKDDNEAKTAVIQEGQLGLSEEARRMQREEDVVWVDDKSWGGEDEAEKGKIGEPKLTVPISPTDSQNAKSLLQANWDTKADESCHDSDPYFFVPRGWPYSEIGSMPSPSGESDTEEPGVVALLLPSFVDLERKQRTYHVPGAFSETKSEDAVEFEDVEDQKLPESYSAITDSGASTASFIERELKRRSYYVPGAFGETSSEDAFEREDIGHKKLLEYYDTYSNAGTSPIDDYDPAADYQIDAKAEAVQSTRVRRSRRRALSTPFASSLPSTPISAFPCPQGSYLFRPMSLSPGTSSRQIVPELERWIDELPQPRPRPSLNIPSLLLTRIPRPRSSSSLSQASPSTTSSSSTPNSSPPPGKQPQLHCHTATQGKFNTDGNPNEEKTLLLFPPRHDHRPRHYIPTPSSPTVSVSAPPTMIPGPVLSSRFSDWSDETETGSWRGRRFAFLGNGARRMVMGRKMREGKYGERGEEKKPGLRRKLSLRFKV